MKIIQDSREQKPLFESKSCLIKKLDVGDYTTTDLLNKLHVERKSPNDLYQTITSGHVRFRNELLRAKKANIRLLLFVECPDFRFYGKFFPNGRKCFVPGSTLQKIMFTLQKKYSLEVVWCFNRLDMESRILDLFLEASK